MKLVCDSVTMNLVCDSVTMNLVCDPRSVHQACALDVFTKGHCSTSRVPKNLTAKVFNNHFLSVAESAQNHERLYTCVPIGHVISANKNYQCHVISVNKNYQCHVISANKNYQCHVIYANKNYQARPICHPILSVSKLGKYISKLEFIYFLIVRSRWYKQPVTKIVTTIHNRLLYTYS